MKIFNSSRLVATLITGSYLVVGLASTLNGQDDDWGHLTGQIIVAGEVPEVEALTVDKDRAFCLKDQDEIFDPSLVVSEDGGLKDAVVMMYFGPRDRKRPAVHESYTETEEAKIVLDNNRCRFEPQVLFLRSSQTLTMRNSDDVGHNCHVALLKNEVNTNIPAGEEVDVQLTEVERFPGLVKCDIHSWMKAIILVRDEPYVAITDADGNFKIENIPAGEWTFQFWHQRPGTMRTLTQDGGEFVDDKRATVKITIEAGETIHLGKRVIQGDELKGD